MTGIIIKQVLLEDKRVDIHIEGNRIRQIGENLQPALCLELDGRGKAVIPGLINTHTHAAMTLFRGIGDDMKLMPWLEQKIWPNEAKLTPEDIYWGAKLACLEMIKSGTTAFSDMYYHPEVTAQVVEEMGMRALLSNPCFDHFQPELAQKTRQANEAFFATGFSCSDRVKAALGPHAIYTVSGELLQWIDAFSGERDLLIHMHLGETEEEVQNSISRFGLSPVRYLHSLGILSPRLILAHAVYVDDEEIRMLADHGVKVVHNPASNMKLASGYCFKFKEMREAGITVGIGTDGCASSNNLDMIEAMKLASLLGKVWRKDPEALPVQQVIEAATRSGASILGMETGDIAVGMLADLCLIDLKQPAFTPNFHFASNLVYAANGSCVDTVICDGKIIMQNRSVPGEEEILERAAAAAYDLVKR